MVIFYQKTIKEKEFRIIDGFQVGSWVYVENPSLEELDKLCDQFHLEIGHMRDALDPYEAPRVEIEKSGLYVFTRLPFQDGDQVITLPILIIIGRNFVMTVTSRPLPFLDKFLTGQIKITTTQKAKFFLQIFGEINAIYNEFIATISRSVRAMKVKLENISNKDIVQFVKFESTLNDFMSALVPNNVMLINILSGKFFRLYENDKDLMEDLSLHTSQLLESCKSNLKNIVNIREVYSAIMTNNLNRVIKFLTALTIILMVPTIIASLYGMNVTLPLSDSPIAFWLVLSVAAVISGALLWLFVKKHWL